MLVIFKNIKKNFKNFGLSILTAVGMFSLNACNNTNIENVIPVCDVNPAVEYAESLGFPNPEVFSPLGKDCDIGDFSENSAYDKVFIKFLSESYSNNKVSLSGLEDFVLRFGDKDLFGKDYSISREEWSAINYAYDMYNLFLSDKALPSGFKFDESMVKALIFPEEYSLNKGLIVLSQRSIASFPQILFDSGKNFMGLEGILTSDSDINCSKLIESIVAKEQGYDHVYYLNSRNVIPLFSNNTFYPLKVISVVDEGTNYSDKHTYSLTFSLENQDSSLIPYDLLIGVAHL